MKVLVYGQGWIGQQFMNILNVPFEKGVSRVDSEKDVLQELLDKQPTHVISFIGRTHGKI